MSSRSSSVEDELKIKLASELERACQVPELNGEVAEVEQVNTELSTILEQMAQNVKLVQTQMKANQDAFNNLKQKLSNAQDHSEEPLDNGVQGYLSRTCDDPFQLDCPVGYGNVRELHKQASVALHLVAVLTCARAKMQKVAKIVDYKVEEF